jgi:acyl-CoA reductase-like NAD-dependent aldehyde dehydrogenase
MPHFPILRWGEPYESLDVEPVVHFATGEALGEVSQANAGLIARDMRRATVARDALRSIPIPELCARLAKAADLFLRAELPAGDGTQTPEAFMTCQSATTGLPEHMCRANMEKLHYVLSNLDKILAALTRRLDPSIMMTGYGAEEGVMRSRQPTTPVLGMVLPSNSPGTHGLWLPVVALQIGLALKPGPQEPWTPYRMAVAYAEAGIPREAIALYPGGAEAGAAIVEHVPRKMIFGSLQTVEQFLLGDDAADSWEDHLDLMVDSILVNGGRSCINCSGIWTPRHGAAIAEAIAARLGPVAPKAPDDPEAALAAFTVPKQAEGIDTLIERGLQAGGADEVTARHRDGDRLVVRERCAYLRPTVVSCGSPDAELANTEYMFPFASVVECPQDEMLGRIGGTLVATVISNDAGFRRDAVDAGHIDRLNLGPIPTFKIDWLQPHEGNIVDFLYRERALQIA